MIIRILAFSAGVYLLWTLWQAMLLDNKVPSWPETKGYVVRSFVKSSGWFYEPVVEYAYNVDGRMYYNNHLRSSVYKHYELSRSSAQDIVSWYPLNKQIKVFFNPQMPQVATLFLFYGGLEDWFTGFYFIMGFMLLVTSFLNYQRYPWGGPTTGLIAEDFQKRSQRKE